jgi:outer membrane protein, multidrug efflux system
MNKNVLCLLVGITVFPAGCTMAPKYTRPAAPVSAEWPSGQAYVKAPATTNAPAASQLTWWEFFADDKLQQVIALAWTNNRDLRLAGLNVERARALYGIQAVELLPVVSASGGGSRQGVPADLSGVGKRLVQEQYSANLGIVAWEVDFFGRIQSLTNRALQEYLATEQARRSAQILLVSEVASAYLTLAADRENLKLAETTLETRRGVYELVRLRHERGLVPELDVHRAQQEVDGARVASARFTQLVAQDENALQLLAGSMVPSDLLPEDLDHVSPPQEISAGLSSEVLLSRPDVLQAEAMLKAAHADIGAARAAFFPRMSLTSTIGTASSELSGLFDAGSRAWSYAPQIVMPIFDARTWFALKATNVQRQIAVAQYEKAIQTSFREVADALAVRGTMDQQLSAQESLVHAASETYRLSNTRYLKGLDSYLSVLDAQRSLYAAQQELVSLRLAKVANQVRLYAVLGGGAQQ